MHWQRTDRARLRRLNRLIDDALRDSSGGIGKPKPVRHVLAGCWSRRIDEDHRPVYQVDDNDLVVLEARYDHE